MPKTCRDDFDEIKAPELSIDGTFGLVILVQKKNTNKPLQAMKINSKKQIIKNQKMVNIYTSIFFQTCLLC